MVELSKASLEALSIERFLLANSEHVVWTLVKENLFQGGIVCQVRVGRSNLLQWMHSTT
jgi:hypothetical protein